MVVPGGKTAVRLEAVEPKRHVDLHGRQKRVDVVVDSKVIGATVVREDVQGKLVVKLVQAEEKVFVQLLDDSLIRACGSHTIFGSPTTLGSKMGCDEMMLDPKLIKKNLMMKEVVGRDSSVAAKMKIICMVPLQADPG